MGEKIEAYLFLAIILGIPILMVLTIFLLLIRKFKRKNIIYAVTNKIGWVKADKHSVEKWITKLEATLFSEVRREEKIKEAWEGCVQNVSVMFARYHSRSNSPYGQLRKGGHYTMLAIQKGSGKPLRIMTRYGGALGSITAKASKGFWVSGENNWEWAFISSNEELQNMNFNSVDAAELKKMMPAGSFLFCYPDFTVFMAIEGFDKQLLENPLEVVRKLMKLLNF